MDKKLAMKWVKALRSGKYKQATDHLKSASGHCCLGVLCEVEKINIQEMVNKNGGDETYHGPSLRDANGKIFDTSLTSLNDCGYRFEGEELMTRLTFDEIADIIQINYEDL